MPKENSQHGILRFFYVGRMDVNLGVCGIVGAVLTVVFYMAFPLPLLRPGYFFSLFAERGWVPYGITFLFFWGVVVILAKFLGMLRERRYLRDDPMSKIGVAAITPEAAQKAASNLSESSRRSNATVLPNRLVRMLQQFSTTAERESMQTVLSEESEIDSAQLSASYVMVKVFVWAIPILGFIGTVIGIVQAVSGFSDFVDASVADIAQIKNGLNLVTSGLSVAFETTLLALVVSLVMMLPMSALQKTEENLLSSFDRYCIDSVISKASVRKVETPTPESAILAKVLEQSMRNQMELLEQFKSSFQSALQRSSQEFSATIDRYSNSHEKGLLEFARSAESMQGRFNELKLTASQMTESVGSAMQAAGSQIREAFESNVSALAKEREAAQKQISSLIEVLVKTANQGASSMEALQKGLESKIDGFVSAVEKQQKAVELLDAANRNLELLTSTKELTGVLETLKAQLAELKPAIENLSRPRTIRVIDEQKPV